MSDEDQRPGARPVPVPRAARELIRQVVDTFFGGAPPATRRSFEVDGEEWIASIVGEAAAGTGAGPAAFLVAIHFSKATAPDVPLREALLPRGRFEALHDVELRALFHTARPLPPGSDTAS